MMFLVIEVEGSFVLKFKILGFLKLEVKLLLFYIMKFNLETSKSPFPKAFGQL